MGHGWTLQPISAYNLIIFSQQPLFPGDSGVDQLVEIIKVNYYLRPNQTAAYWLLSLQFNLIFLAGSGHTHA